MSTVAPRRRLRLRRLGRLVVVLTAARMLGACLLPAAQPCGAGGVCPPGQRCGLIEARAVCVAGPCGDGRLDPDERCDDGNNVSGDGCPAECGAPCGDAVRDPGERCDDGNNLDGDGCSASCDSLERCGNAIVDPDERCDDGDLRNHDGCSSACAEEQDGWALVGERPEPGPGALAYDAERGVLVLYSAAGVTWERAALGWRRRSAAPVPTGAPGSARMFFHPVWRRVVLLGDLRSEPTAWEWDGRGWLRRAMTAPTPHIAGYEIAYDHGRGELLLYGGVDLAPEDRTWSWDGATWREVETAVRPPRRTAHAMAYDAARGKVVLYGGAGSTSGSSVDSRFDTWEYDGAQWSLRATLGPPRHLEHRLAYDATRGRVVMSGGAPDRYSPRGDPIVVPESPQLWEWDGTRWRALPGVVDPPPRRAAMLAYDAVRAELALFGGLLLGADGAAAANDTWRWQGDTWRSDDIAPPPRSRHSMGYQASRGSAVLFGGFEQHSGATLGDTWTWDEGGWRARAVLSNSPAPRAAHAMSYDSARDRVTLFGGERASGAALFDDLWEWDGERWRARDTAIRPAARRGHALVYDAARGETLLVGGQGSGGLLDDTWAWDGTAWQPRDSAVRPGRRREAAATYDVGRGKVVLFGGEREASPLGDVWEWNGETWEDRTPTTVFRPAARAGHTLIYDARRRRVVLFGGRGAAGEMNDTWAWDGAAWSKLTSARAPAARQRHAAIEDAIHGGILVFGGERSSMEGGAVQLHDLWSLRSEDSAALDEPCAGAGDGDGDGLRGCDDPDCTARCQRCGDGVVDALETCSLCPADVGVCQNENGGSREALAPITWRFE